MSISIPNGTMLIIRLLLGFPSLHNFASSVGSEIATNLNSKC